MWGNKREKPPENRLRQVWSASLPDHVIRVGWSSDGRRVAAAAVSGPVWVWEAASGKPLFELKGHGFGTMALAFQPQGSVLATCGQDGTIRLWDPVIGRELQTMEGGAAWVERLAWSPDGRYLATAAGKKVRIWDAATGMMLREYGDHPATVADLAWEPQGRLLAVAVYGGVRLYDPLQADVQNHLDWKGAPLKLAWSPNGKMLAHGNQEATVHFWYVASGEDLEMSGYPSKIRELSWEFTSRSLVTGGGEMVCIWDCGGSGPANTTPKMLKGHAEPVTVVAYQHRGFLLASGGQDGRLCVWQPANRAPMIGAVTFEATDISDLAWSPDDRSLFAGSGQGTVGLFQVT